MQCHGLIEVVKNIDILVGLASKQQEDGINSLELFYSTNSFEMEFVRIEIGFGKIKNHFATKNDRLVRKFKRIKWKRPNLCKRMIFHKEEG